MMQPLTTKLYNHSNPSLLCIPTGENWRTAKKETDRAASKLPSLADFGGQMGAVSALNGVLRKLMTLGELNLYAYSGGMPALYGTAGNGAGVPTANGTAVPRVNGVAHKVNGKDIVQVRCAGERAL